MEERLQKYMARCGVASRRKCEEIILSGNVKVNNKLVNELGVKINSEVDIVSYEGKIIKPEEKKLYIMLNKPEGYITSVKDEKGRKTILDLVKVDERIYPIGRLDYDSSGLILLTNDGDIYNKIIHPRVKMGKKYIVLCKGEFSKEELNRFENGIDIGGYVTAKAKIEVIDKEKCKNNSINTLVEITIHEGKNRQIRKMCEALNHPVISLNRISIGDLKLGYLKKGEWRYLTENELKYLNSL
ncbi:MAG: rRNA pseudouridine synthase [Clostridium sp.]|uniref:pseudouridine synthase n=1 Tax=Clostridium sp. TaxID=1506 RepID=UPI0025C010EA|nr:pseudouridine synthase [Clostridium sp.]MCF0148627.1 rRNA pseudouridine synthase [Clostridium sp.]